MVTPTVVPFPATLEIQLRLQFDGVCVGQYALTLLDHTSGTPLLPAGSKLQHDWIRHLRGHARRLVHLSSVLTDDERQSLGTALELLNLDGTGNYPLSICQPPTNNTGVRMIRSSILPRLFQAFVACPANEPLILILHLGNLTPHRLVHYYLGPPYPSASPTPPPLAPSTENLPGPVGVASSPTASFHSRDMPPRNSKPAPVSIASVGITPTPVPAARSSNPTSLSSTDDHRYGTEEGNSFLFTPVANGFAPIPSDTPPLYEDRKPSARVYTVSEDTISDPTALTECRIDTRRLADAMRGNTSVITLTLQQRCSDEERRVLVQALVDNRGLVTLDLSSAPITDDLWTALWQSVARHPKLEDFVLSKYISTWSDGATDAQKTKWQGMSEENAHVESVPKTDAAVLSQLSGLEVGPDLHVFPRDTQEILASSMAADPTKVSIVEVVRATANSRRFLRSSVQPVKVKMENPITGMIRCPHADCMKGSYGICASDKGCNVITCTEHTPYYYFCYHCKIEVPGGENSACECPKRNNKETRAQQVAKRTEKSRQNPIELDDSFSGNADTDLPSGCNTTVQDVGDSMPSAETATGGDTSGDQPPVKRRRFDLV
jgi:hypothetical protein